MRQGNYSITNNDQYSYSVVLREVEKFELTSLEFNGLVFHPLRYREEFKANALYAHALVKVSSGDERNQIRELIETGARLSVIRHGINEEPIQMRFGMCGWTDDGEDYKYELYLVDLKHDEGQGPRHIVSIERQNRHDWLAFQIGLTEKLCDALVQKALLTQEEVDALKDDTLREIRTYRHLFTRVGDVEELEALPE